MVRVHVGPLLEIVKPYKRLVYEAFFVCIKLV